MIPLDPILLVTIVFPKTKALMVFKLSTKPVFIGLTNNDAPLKYLKKFFLDKKPTLIKNFSLNGISLLPETINLISSFFFNYFRHYFSY